MLCDFEGQEEVEAPGQVPWLSRRLSALVSWRLMLFGVNPLPLSMGSNPSSAPCRCVTLNKSLEPCGPPGYLICSMPAGLAGT